eukprot:TRINITY_DN2605_c0_g6_i1.p2 TRINITY_DN2605_c0_g6~~TRINITY_DN2605_c0_g6_i1.p2  ORF type:complete len:135 (-),score=32.85 TRINITY_DN2605_c0_g6_i1:17-421(-)
MVDINNEEVYEKLIVAISALIPAADQHYELRLNRHVQADTEFEYKNDKREPREIEFVCSSPEICSVARPVQVVQSGEAVKVPIVIRPGPFGERQMMFVYAVDKESAKSEALLFSLIFTDSVSYTHLTLPTICSV